MAKKFVKVSGLHNIFNATSATTLDITSIKTEVADRVNSNSIVFITANSEDVQYGYPNGSKYIWTCNELYPTNDSSITLNGVTTTSASFYAPTVSATAYGQVLVFGGTNSAPIWSSYSFCPTNSPTTNSMLYYNGYETQWSSYSFMPTNSPTSNSVLVHGSSENIWVDTQINGQGIHGYASVSIYGPTNSGQPGQFIMSSGSGAPRWTTTISPLSINGNNIINYEGGINTVSIYGPTASGSNGQFLMSTGLGAPTWSSVSDEKVKLNHSTTTSNIPLLAAPISNPSDGSTYESAFSNNIVLNPNTITLVVGENCENSGTDGITEGYYTRTWNVAEHAQGAMNLSHNETGKFDGNPRNTVHSIGIGLGTAESNRKNAVEVMQNGDTYIKGIGNYDGTDFNKSTNILPIQQCIVQSSDVLRIWQGTQIEYDNLPIKYSNTLYLIKDDSEEVEYVDLGLSSGNLWAKYNLGASYSETNANKWYGGYFAWGEIEPRQSFTEAEYKYGIIQDDTLKFIKYCNDESAGINNEYTDNLVELLPEDDAASPVLGNGAEMPTELDFFELFEQLSVTEIQDYQGISGLNGLLFEGNGDELFIPAAGYYIGDELQNGGVFVMCWTKTLVTSDKARALENMTCIQTNRYFGLPIRAIKRQN